MLLVNGKKRNKVFRNVFKNLFTGFRLSRRMCLVFLPCELIYFEMNKVVRPGVLYSLVEA